MALIAKISACLVAASLITAISFFINLDIKASRSIRLTVSFIFGVFVSVGLYITLRHIDSWHITQPLPINSNVTKFLNFEPVHIKPVDVIALSAQISNETVTNRKINGEEASLIINNEMYLVRLPAGYTVKVIPPAVKPEITEMPVEK